MPFRIVRNDLTKMQVDAIVNTANEAPIYSDGTDTAVYLAAGVEELLEARKKIGYLHEGEVCITPGFQLPAQYIIHTVSPVYIDGTFEEAKKLRSCYAKSLKLAKEYGCKSLAFPLIATGSFGYPKEEGLRIAADEINAFLLENDMLVYLVVFDQRSCELSKKLWNDLHSYIDQNYVDEAEKREYKRYSPMPMADMPYGIGSRNSTIEEIDEYSDNCEQIDLYDGELSQALDERLEHISDSFASYLQYLIKKKGYTNVEVYKRALVSKQSFAKIINNPGHCPKKITALCLAVGARLSLDETKDLLARAGYALSPCDKKDIIFSFFIENEIYDMLEIDIALEEYGEPCLIS